jgi:GTP-binding protein
VDASSEDVLRDFQVVQQELAAYGNGLDERPCLVALNKTELLLDDELKERIQLVSDHCGQPVLDVSAATSKNLDQLLSRVWKELGV